LQEFANFFEAIGKRSDIFRYVTWHISPHL
jgi:hypothetical protein